MNRTAQRPSSPLNPVKTLALIALGGMLHGQQPPQPPLVTPVSGSEAPITLTLQDVLSNAQTTAPQLLSALADANSAHEDLVQARAAIRPSLSGRSDYLN